MARGGYQQPSRPAPASGPGPLSQRTDGGPGQAMRQLSNPEYGEQADFQEIQSSAKMSQGLDFGSLGQGSVPSGPQVTAMGSPTQRPDEPVTAGAPSGPGAGPEAVGHSVSAKEQAVLDARQVARYLPSLERMANRPDALPSFVRFVKYLREFKE